jgi:hypothetical protein
MDNHLTKDEMKGYYEKSLPLSTFTQIYKHLSSCWYCLQRFRELYDFKDPNSKLAFFIAPHPTTSVHLDTDEELFPYVYGELSEIDKEDVEDHISRCLMCREEVESLKAQVISRENRQALEKPISKLERLLSLLGFPGVSLPQLSYPIAIITLLVTISFGYIYFLSKDNIPAKEALNHIDSQNSASTQALSSTDKLEYPDSGFSENSISDSFSNKSKEEVAILKDKQYKHETSKSFSRQLESEKNNLFIQFANNSIVYLEDLNKEINDIPQDIQQTLKSALSEQPIVLNSLNEIGKQDVERASHKKAKIEKNGPSSEIKLVHPLRVVIQSTSPTFKWSNSENVVGYKVQVFKLSSPIQPNSSSKRYIKILESSLLPANTTSWPITTPLERGEHYLWILRLYKENGEVISIPNSFSSEMRFKVLDTLTFRFLNKLKRKSTSNLALGLFYAKEGLLVESEEQFNILQKKYPSSPLINELHKRIQEWTLQQN